MSFWSRNMEKWFVAFLAEPRKSWIEFDDFEEETFFDDFDKLHKLFEEDLQDLLAATSIMTITTTTTVSSKNKLKRKSRKTKSNHSKRVIKELKNSKPFIIVRNRNSSSKRKINRSTTMSLPFTAPRETRELLCDVITTDTQVKVIAEIPHVTKENIRVKAYEDNSVEVTSAAIINDPNAKSYHRIIHMPVDIDIDTARSTYRNGILEITFNRKTDR